MSEKYNLAISGGVCTSGCSVNLCNVPFCVVSNYSVARGGIMRTGKQNSLYDMSIDGNLFASDTYITKMSIPNGAVQMMGSAIGSNVLVGGHLDMDGSAKVNTLDIIDGGRVAMTDGAWVNDATICRGGKLTMYGETSANRLIISSGASCIAYGQAELLNVTVKSGGYLECFDDTYTSDVYLENGAKFMCRDGAQVVYTRDSPQKIVIFDDRVSRGHGEDGFVDVYRAKVTVFSEGGVEVELPVPLKQVFKGQTVNIAWKGKDDAKVN